MLLIIRANILDIPHILEDSSPCSFGMAAKKVLPLVVWLISVGSREQRTCRLGGIEDASPFVLLDDHSVSGIGVSRASSNPRRDCLEVRPCHEAKTIVAGHQDGVAMRLCEILAVVHGACRSAPSAERPGITSFSQATFTGLAVFALPSASLEDSCPPHATRPHRPNESITTTTSNVIALLITTPSGHVSSGSRTHC